jgi:glycosyl transferase, family 25
MHSIVINLDAARDRWHAMQRQFAAAGLEPTRLEGVAGHALQPREIARLYSRARNRAQYHRELRPGEIGCYASHLGAWQQFIAGSHAHLAVFEDDIEIEPSIGSVLDAIARLRGDWDMVKLIGRPDREKVASCVPLPDGRQLATYLRVPSRTAAYVISRRGARKLLARRPPFGRPIDIDLRHWWECDLSVLGVLPYPVREGPASCRSSIVGREEGCHSLAVRLRKLGLQWRYTRDNRRACLARDVGDARQPQPLPGHS